MLSHRLPRIARRHHRFCSQRLIAAQPRLVRSFMFCLFAIAAIFAIYQASARVKAASPAAATASEEYFVFFEVDSAITTGCLRKAILDANAHPGTDTITITTTKDLLLKTELPPITDNVVIRGLGKNIVVQRGGYFPEAQTDPFRVFHVAPNVNATFHRLTITNGNLKFYEPNEGQKGAGILNEGILTLSSCVVTGNDAMKNVGGGIYNTGTLFINNSSIVNNHATSGGGIVNGRFGTVRMTESTVSGNTADDAGGGISNAGALYIYRSTVTNNRATKSQAFGGGISSTPEITGGAVTTQVGGSILYGNSAPASPEVRVTGNGNTLASLDYNLFGNTAGATISGATSNNITGRDPLLFPLGDYGGDGVLTHALRFESPAVDAGQVFIDPYTYTDARGNLRVVDGDGDGAARSDIGAFEIQRSVVTTAGDGFVAGHLTLRDALRDSHGAIIAFDIPATDPGCTPSGICTINLTSALPAITQHIHIDGYTQPGATRNSLTDGDNANLLIEINGAAAGADTSGLHITAGNSIVEGLVINRFASAGIYLDGANSTNNRISGNRIGTDASGSVALPNFFGVDINNAASNIIGTDSDGTGDLGERNLISGNSHAGININGETARQNIIAGNRIGTNAFGSAAIANMGDGISINAAPDNRIGGTTAAARNIISGNAQNGIVVAGSTANNNTIIGNYIGTNSAGMSALRNRAGVRLSNGALNHVGTSDAGNVISGNSDGVVLGTDGARGNFVQNNLIGIAADGATPLGNTGSASFGHGVVVNNSRDNLIGSTSAGVGNRIAYNSSRGIYVVSGVNNTLRGNSIFSNGALGIDLGAVGADTNDDLDADTGANNLQNYPSIFTADYNGANVHLTGTLESAPATTFTLDFYSNTACDASGLGEGESLIGSSSVTTDASGRADFNLTFAIANLPGQFVATTATDPAGNTSEFSLCRPVTFVNSSLQFTQGTYAVTEGADTSATFTVTRAGSGAGAISVNYSITPYSQFPATGGASCAAGIDYINTAGTLTWASGDMTPKTITVPICNDHTVEETELFRMSLSNPTGASILGNQNTTLLLIHDDDSFGSLQFSDPTFTATEESRTATVTVTRTGTDGPAVGVSYATTAGGTATGGTSCGISGVDYVQTSGTLSWSDGDVSSKTVTITLCDDDAIDNGETINLVLSNPTGGASLGTPGTATLNVTDGDLVFEVTNTNNAGAGSLREAITNANLSGTQGTVTINFASGVNGSIDLLTSLPDLNARMVINGPAADRLMVRRSQTSGTPDFRILQVNRDRTVNLSGLTIANGRSQFGAGLINNGTMTIRDSVITGNTSLGSGGGIGNLFYGTLTLIDSTVWGNSASESFFSGGGGISNEGVMKVVSSTISGNTTSGGGGILNRNKLTVTHSTITANTATARGGGGIYQEAPFGDVITSTTITSSIVAGNNSPNSPDLSGEFGVNDFTSGDYNLIGNTAGANIIGAIDHNLTGVDARLAPLATNGGTTPTHALLADSPAIDVGGSDTDFTTDQRGLPRPADGNGDGTSVADIGAFELQPTCSLNLIPETIPAGVAGTSYMQTLTATGGTAPYTFSVGAGVLPSDMSLSQDGMLTGTPGHSGEFHFTITATDANGCSGNHAYSFIVEEPAPTCAVDITSSVVFTRSGFSQNLVTRRFRQTVTIRNTSATTMAGATTLVLDNLSSNAVLYNPAGQTLCAAPLGSMYVNVPVGPDGLFTPGETVTITLEFTNSNPNQSITYTSRLLNGSGMR